MSHEALPSKEAGNALDKYMHDRKKIVGGDILKSGLKTAAVGLFATAAVLSSRYWLLAASSYGAVIAPVGLIAAAAVGGYGVMKAIEGGVKRLVARGK